MREQEVELWLSSQVCEVEGKALCICPILLKPLQWPLVLSALPVAV